MRRRDFISSVTAYAAWAPAARAQPERMRRIGVLVTLAPDDPENQARLIALREGLEKFGWSEGRNVHTDLRFARPIARAHDLARELIALQPDVIVAQATPIATALKQETETVPVVFVAVSDPIGEGFVSSLARPNSNLTGLMLVDSSVTSKWLGMLKEVSPQLRRVAVVANPKIAYGYWLRAAQVAAPALGVDIVPGPVETASDIQKLIETFAQTPNGGLLLPPDFSTQTNRKMIIALAAQFRLPAVYTERNWVSEGGLMSYGVAIVDLFRQAAYYVDRILRGAKPSDLPVQGPATYQTVLNLRTAKAIGLNIPESMLVRADEVIE
jgi:putative tryptophan/tyrosine transport system substrate-binding protein